MAKVSLAELSAAAAQAQDPDFASASIPKPGGVDPLGLRQINFDLMDHVFPGLNNVARHLRPFVVVTWAWRRAHQLAQRLGAHDVKLHGELQDFVDRVDVIYAWSQFLSDPKAELPGQDVLAPLLKAQDFTFGGAAWEKQRKVRRLSTALSAPINYGPALKTLGWIHPNPAYPAVMMSGAAAAPALDAFEAGIADLLDHDAFSKFGSVVVTREEARDWARRWALQDVTDAEAAVMRELLLGAVGEPRRKGAALLLAAAKHAKSTDEARLRGPIAGAPSDFIPPADLVEIRDAWRRVQMRQLFRLSMEALLHWTIMKLGDRTLASDALVAAFIAEVPAAASAASGDWLAAMIPAGTGPTELIARIQQALTAQNTGAIAQAVSAGIAFSLSEDPGTEARAERSDRLPLFRARHEAAAHASAPAAEFIRHVLESWVLAQHAYWSVGRGLADARAGGKTLLRLRVILDEGGWTLTPVKRGRPPAPTPDRLRTMISLMKECRLLGQNAS
jgi:hypothetical protein